MIFDRLMNFLKNLAEGILIFHCVYRTARLCSPHTIPLSSLKLLLKRQRHQRTWQTIQFLMNKTFALKYESPPEDDEKEYTLAYKVSVASSGFVFARREKYLVVQNEMSDTRYSFLVY